MERKATIVRKTGETDITIKFRLSSYKHRFIGLIFHYNLGIIPIYTFLLYF